MPWLAAHTARARRRLLLASRRRCCCCCRCSRPTSPAGLRRVAYCFVVAASPRHRSNYCSPSPSPSPSASARCSSRSLAVASAVRRRTAGAIRRPGRHCTCAGWWGAGRRSSRTRLRRHPRGQRALSRCGRRRQRRRTGCCSYGTMHGRSRGASGSSRRRVGPSGRGYGRSSCSQSNLSARTRRMLS